MLMVSVWLNPLRLANYASEKEALDAENSASKIGSPTGQAGC
jgi:hypothetical protein